MKFCNKKKPIVLIAGHLPPPQEGTAKLNKVILDSEYLSKSFKIIFLSLLKRINPTNRGRLGVINVFYNFINFFNYIKYLIRYQPQLIYMPLSQNKVGFIRDSVFILIGKFLKRKVCVHFHGGSFDLFYKCQKDLFQKYIRFTLRRIDKLILLAEKFKKQFTPIIASKKISFLYNCVPERFETCCSNNCGIKDKLKVLFVGYISKAKGAFDFVKAASLVIDDYKKPVEFILCGQPVDVERNIVFIPDPHNGFSKIQEFIKEKNLYQNIKIYPEVNSVEKIKMFIESDIFVLPSYSEGCALVVLEAMFFGLPIITTPVGALEEMIENGKNCFFVSPGDDKDIADKIIALLNNTDLRETMGKANKKLIIKAYNSDIFLDGLGSIWKSVLCHNLNASVEKGK